MLDTAGAEPGILPAMKLLADMFALTLLLFVTGCVAVDLWGMFATLLAARHGHLLWGLRLCPYRSENSRSCRSSGSST